MIYADLPPVGSFAAPELTYSWSPNRSSRNGRTPSIIFNHRWDGGTYDSVREWFRSPHSQVSAHVVYGGVADGATQMVPWGQKAWTQCDFNSVGISVESADAIWLGHDVTGFAQLARLTALLLHLHGLPARWLREDMLLHSPKGHCRHADAGQLGCGHPYCPTTDLALFEQFHGRVVAELRHGGFRSSYGQT